ncbi:MAG TPA: alpha/beta hydrolase [Devosia sp.]|jgi:acetyl esterase/lipase|uniref:alpha/beta hydrolase n=1 Tax=Devosia sp. TaxID=1871048 RepID=UPI002DDD18C9|nr:alpha/beta hydrolase [Devosia sp.]HEV2513952.1 alpha/beta hydrolase [Devosia sp.]
MSFSLVGLLNFASPKDRRSWRLASGVSYGRWPKQKLDIYGPRAAGGPVPVVIYLYGGAWNEGDRRDFAFVARWLAGLGTMVVVPDYRVLPEVEYPVFLEDCADAVRWTLQHAAEFGGDATRLALAGHSAGAYNAVMLALEPAYGVSAAVDAVVGLSGPYNFYPFDVPISIRTFSGAPDPLATQPVNLVSAAAPPMFLASADDDTVVGPQNTVALAKRLREVGAEVVERHFPRFTHPSTLLELGSLLTRRSSLAGDVAGFLARTLQLAPSDDDAMIGHGQEGAGR